MPDQDSIIVAHRFHSFIEANLAKAKLDAYGVPCFLTEENVTFLTTALLSGGIRLHIFEQDKERVEQLLTENNLQKSEEDDLMCCPACGSKRILDVSSERLNPSTVVKFILQLNKRHYCTDCEAEFD